MDKPEPKYALKSKVCFTQSASTDASLLSDIEADMLGDRVDPEKVDEFIVALQNRKPMTVVDSSVHKQLARAEHYYVVYEVQYKKVRFGMIDELLLEPVKGK